MNRLKAKKRALPSTIDKTKDLQKMAVKSIQKANERIKSLERKYKGTTYMWSVNKLTNKLSEYTKKNRIKIPKKIRSTELIKIIKEVESFLKSAQSTKKGVKEVQQKAKQTMKKDLFDADITDNDVDAYYSLLEDNDFSTLLDKDFDASDFWVIIDDAINNDDSLNDFLDRIETYKNIPDETTRRKVERIYYKYVN